MNSRSITWAPVCRTGRIWCRLTDYLRYELACYERNTQAGEDIRLVPTPRGSWPNEVPQGSDFWLFDDSDVWKMAYDVSGGFIAAEHCDPTDDISPYRRWRDAALRRSIPLADYLTRTA